MVWKDASWVTRGAVVINEYAVVDSGHVGGGDRSASLGGCSTEKESYVGWLGNPCFG